jgi:hypothetical protein
MFEVQRSNILNETKGLIEMQPLYSVDMPRNLPKNKWEGWGAAAKVKCAFCDKPWRVLDDGVMVCSDHESTPASPQDGHHPSTEPSTPK